MITVHFCIVDRTQWGWRGALGVRLTLATAVAFQSELCMAPCCGLAFGSRPGCCFTSIESRINHTRNMK